MKTSSGKTVKAEVVRRVAASGYDPFIFACGGCVISFKECDAAALLDMCMKSGLMYRSLSTFTDVDGERRAVMLCTLGAYRRILKSPVVSEGGIEARLERRIGLPFILKRYRYRFGIFVGFIIMCAIIYASLGVIWDVRVVGNDSVSELEVISELEKVGLSVGKRIKALDIDETENRLLINSDSLAWVSINLIGTVANVEVIEKQSAPQTAKAKPSNLVAKQNGEIVALEVYTGHPSVKLGDIVSKGDILVSGIYDSPNFGFRLRPSRGKVFAKTAHRIEIEIPYEYRKKVYTGVEIRENKLIFFSNIIKLSKNSGNLPSSCDTIKESKIFSLFGGENMPITLETVRYLEYGYEDTVRTCEEALELAFDELEVELCAYTEDAALVSKSTRTEIGEASVRLICDIRIIEDIAENVEFEYDILGS